MEKKNYHENLRGISMDPPLAELYDLLSIEAGVSKIDLTRTVMNYVFENPVPYSFIKNNMNVSLSSTRFVPYKRNILFFDLNQKEDLDKLKADFQVIARKKFNLAEVFKLCLFYWLQEELNLSIKDSSSIDNESNAFQQAFNSYVVNLKEYEAEVIEYKKQLKLERRKKKEEEKNKE